MAQALSAVFPVLPRAPAVTLALGAFFINQGGAGEKPSLLLMTWVPHLDLLISDQGSTGGQPALQRKGRRRFHVST